MPDLTKQTVEALAKLSRIHCNEDEQERLFKDLEKIVAYIEQLKEINTDDVSHRNQILEGTNNVMRDDVVGDSMPRETFLMNAPSQIGGMIRVPIVIKKHNGTEVEIF
ncbi:MAG: Asp-tRNA(Asn)/Glu-tRNA(Gln) amidotransferase subunit GatC [Parachlamydiaceae bacterium]